MVGNLDVCAEVCTDGIRRYNFGCDPNPGCLCSSVVGLGSLALWVSGCSDPEASWNNTLVNVCPGTQLPISEDYSPVLENATLHAIPASSVKNLTSLFYPVMRDDYYYLPHLEARIASLRQRQINKACSYYLLLYWGFLLTSVCIYRVTVLLVSANVLKSPVFGNDYDFFRYLQTKIILPAANGTKNCRPSYILGYKLSSTTRLHALIICAYTALNFALLSSRYDIITSNPLFSTNISQLSFRLGIRSGILATMQLPLVFLFAFRNNFLISMTGLAYSSFLLYHRAVSRVMYLDIIIHTLSFSSYEVIEGRYRSFLKWNFVQWGIVTIIVGGLVTLSSARYFRDRNYEIFLVLHIVFASIFVVGTWKHVANFGYGSVLYWVFGFWIFDKILRLFRILHFGLHSKSKVRLLEDGIIEFKIPVRNKINVRAGHYLYLHVLKFNAWESHPFSIVEYNKRESNIVLLVKPKDGVTKKIKSFLTRVNQKVTLSVCVDGFYGKRIPIDNYSKALLIAGGIGLTAVMPYAFEFSNNGIPSDLTFVWIIHDRSSLEWGSRYLEKLTGAGCKVIIYETNGMASIHREDGISSSQRHNEETVFQMSGDYRGGALSLCSVDAEREGSDDTIEAILPAELLNYWASLREIILRGRPDMGSLIRNFVANNLDNGMADIAIIVCGPPGMNDDSRIGYIEALKATCARLDYYEEFFN